MINQERLVSSFMEMVKIASPSGKEQDFANYLRDKLSAIGLEVVTDKQAAAAAGVGTGNLIARLPGNKPGAPGLLFAAHMDTVSPGEGIEPILKDGTICSRGETILGADDKSGIAALLEAMQDLLEEKVPHGELEMLFTFGEEVGLLGSRYLTQGLIHAKQGFVLDSGGEPGTVINQGPAQDNFTAVIYGKAAHAGVNPEDGISAIQVAARAIDRMKLLRIDPETTANIGLIAGGTATNIVCDKVELKGEARSLAMEKLEKQSAHMKSVLEDTCAEFNARLELKIKREYPSFKVEPDEPVIRLAKAAAAKTGLEAKVISSGGGSDVNCFNARGLQTVNLSTGMTKVHTTQEYIKPEDLVKTAAFVAAIIAEAGAIA